MYPVFVHVLAGQGVCGVNKICAEPSRLDGGGGESSGELMGGAHGQHVR